MQKTFAFISAILWLADDYASKQWALLALANDNIIVINQWMNYKLAHNSGAAFSLFADGGGWQRWFFMAIAVVIGAWLCYAILFERTTALIRFAYAGILGGALGNLYDRIVYGKVVDFIRWHVGDAYWPTFNVADVGICTGVGLLVIAWIWDWHKGKAS